MKRLVHVITGLSQGGAETLLFRVLSTLDASQFQSSVISLTDRGALGDAIERLGVRVQCLQMRAPNPVVLGRLVSLIRHERPHVVQTWMYHSDLLGGIAAKLAGGVPVVWGLHHADPQINKPLTRQVARACSLLSGCLPSRIIACSDHARATHLRFGYAPRRMVGITNGIDTDAFAPHADGGAEIRREFGLSSAELLVGHVARWHPIKDHAGFLRAAAILAGEFPGVQFVLAGQGVDACNPELSHLVQQAGLGNAVHLLGGDRAIPALMNSFDIFVSSSLDESFSLVLGEAMACSVPCVATDVGIAAELLGETGVVVAPGNPEALAAGIRRLLQLSGEERARLGDLARERIVRHYAMTRMIRQYEALYAEVIEESPGHWMAHRTKGGMKL